MFVNAHCGHHIAHHITLLLAMKMLFAVWAKVSGCRMSVKKTCEGVLVFCIYFISWILFSGV